MKQMQQHKVRDFLLQLKIFSLFFFSPIFIFIRKEKRKLYSQLRIYFSFIFIFFILIFRCCCWFVYFFFLNSFHGTFFCQCWCHHRCRQLFVVHFIFSLFFLSFLFCSFCISSTKYFHFCTQSDFLIVLVLCSLSYVQLSIAIEMNERKKTKTERKWKVFFYFLLFTLLKNKKETKRNELTSICWTHIWIERTKECIWVRVYLNKW